MAPSFIDFPGTFEEVNHLYCTAPVLLVHYFREPYVSDVDDYGRITFDRALRYGRRPGLYPGESMRHSGRRARSEPVLLGPAPNNKPDLVDR